MAFDPKAFLAEDDALKTNQKGFDPKAFLQEDDALRGGLASPSLPSTAPTMTPGGMSGGTLTNARDDKNQLEAKFREMISSKSPIPLSSPSLSSQDAGDALVRAGESPIQKAERLGKAYLGGGAIPSAIVGAAKNPILNKVFPPLMGMQVMDDIANAAFSGKPISQIAQESTSNPNNINFDLGQQVEQFKQDAAKHAGVVEQWKAGSPIMSLVGSIPKNYVEFAGGEGLLNATKLRGLAAKTPKLGIGKIMEGIKGANRSGIVNTAISQLDNPGFDMERIKDDYVLGTAIDGGLRTASGVYQGLKKIGTSDQLRNSIEAIPYVGKWTKNNREGVERKAKDFYEEQMKKFREVDADREFANKSDIEKFKIDEKARLENHNTGVNNLKADFQEQEAARKVAYELEKIEARTNLDLLPQKDRVSAVQDLMEKLKEANSDLGKSYDKSVTPIMKKYGNLPVSTEGLTVGANKLADSIGAIGKDGRLNSEDFISSDYKSVINHLEKIIKKSTKNKGYAESGVHLADDGMTFRQLDNLAKQLKAESGVYSKGIGQISQPEMILSKLSDTGREVLSRNLEKTATGEELRSVFKAKRQYAQQKPLLNKILKFDRGAPESVAQRARNILPASFAEQLVTTFPQARNDVAETLLNVFKERATSAKALTKEIDRYGRDSLKKILGNEKYKALENAEKAFGKTSTPWAQLRGQAPKPIEFKPGQQPALRPPLPEPNAPGPYRGDIEKITDWFKERFDDNAPRSAIKRLMRNLGKKGMQAPRGIKYLLPEREDLSK